MALSILTKMLGPLENNTYLIACTETGEAAVIDPSFGSQILVEEASSRGWTIRHIWLTHAHFDHIAGVTAMVSALKTTPMIGIHPADLNLWQQLGGAPYFGFQIDPLPDPTPSLVHGEYLALGNEQLEVRHTPGHTPGHVIFYCPGAKSAFCGDLIFLNSIGRTDLPGGDYDTLIGSIHLQVFTLPPETVLYSGHGPTTTVENEQRENPFLS